MGYVFAEVSNKHDGFVYILIQDRRTGATLTLHDDRAAIKAGMGGGTMTSGLSALLGGGSGGGK